jgi:hypothetical protein
VLARHLIRLQPERSCVWRDGVRNFDAAYLVKLAAGSSTREVVIEFTAPSAVASAAYAEEVTRRFLGDEQPPQHLVVELGGAVSILTEPLLMGHPA